MASDETVFVVDDDAAVRDSLRALLESAGFPVRDFASARDVLADPTLSQGGCLIADIRMPDMDGLELQQVLVNCGIGIPVIVITGHGDVLTAVRAMKAGAVDFIEKPFDDEALIESVRWALALADNARANLLVAQAAEQRILTLSERERQVLECLVTGRPNKIIAFELDISPRTVEVHRAQVMKKMQARSLSDLVRQALALGISPSS